MKEYNFAKNYENIKSWEYKKNIILSSPSDNYLEKFIKIIKSYPNLVLIIKTKKIVYMPTLFVFVGFVILEAISIVPIINIKRLEKNHYEFEEKVNALNEINMDREEKFNILKDHSSLLSNPAQSYLFAFYLQKSMPKNVQLLDYLVDNSGFKLNAVSNDFVSANKFISLLRENKLIDKESIKINRIINQAKNNQNSLIEQTVPIDSIALEISGKIIQLPLIERIRSSRESKDYGNLKKLESYFNLIELIR